MFSDAMHRTRSNERPLSFSSSPSASPRIGTEHAHYHIEGDLSKRPAWSAPSPSSASSSSSPSLLPSLFSSLSSQFSFFGLFSFLPPSSSSSSSPSSLAPLVPSLRRRPIVLLFVLLFLGSSLLAFVRVSSITEETHVTTTFDLLPHESAVGSGSGATYGGPLTRLLNDLRPDEIRTHLEYLSDDLMEGRGTGTRGEELAALYIASQMKLIGLTPPYSSSPSSASSSATAQDEGSASSVKDYIIDVPLVGISTESRVASPLIFTRSSRGGGDDDDGDDEDGSRVELQLWDDFVVTADYQAIVDKPPPTALAGDDHITKSESEAEEKTKTKTNWRVEADELVFLGFGIHATEWARNDYLDAEGAEVDLRGKLVVCFVNEPQPTDNQPDLFEGNKLTYYGRWTYKVEEVRRRGARGVFLIYTPDTAGYPFTVISNNREPLQVPAKRFDVGLEVVAWLTEESAAKLATLCGATLSEWYEAAVAPGFRARSLPVSTTLDVVLGVRSFRAKNVAGLLPGDSDEWTLITAHHDHLGVGPPGEEQDRIYNGAVDNASGVAMMLALARALAQHKALLKRSLLFVSLTGEEAGLIGAQAYVADPPVPLARTVANINFDMLNLDGPTTDIVGLGCDESKLCDLFSAAARDEGLSVSGDPNPGQGSFIRSDSWVFHKAGVPSIYPWTGKHFVGQAPDYAAVRKADYVKNKYHGPGDEYDSRWSLAGAIQQGRVALRMVHALATTDYRGLAPR